MNSAQYTTGEWSINNWPQSNTDIAIGAVGTPLIARVPLRDVSINEQKANAILIAAAPDMIAALYRAAAALESVTYSDPSITSALDAAQSAIAKATGAQA